MKERIRMKRAFVSTVSMLSAGVLVAAVAPAAAAAPSVTVSSESAAGGQTCPAVQMILINSAEDSAAGAEDSGFLSTVSTDVMDTANGDTPDDPSYGFAADTDEPASEPSPSDDLWADTSSDTGDDSAVSGDDLWGGTGATPTTSTEDTGASLWDEPTPADDAAESDDTTAEAAGSDEESTEPVEETTAADDGAEWQELDSEADVTETVADVGDDNVGRTFIDFEGPRTGAFIPGVTGPETGDYDESVTAAVDKTEGVLADINEQCPDTQVIIIGYSQGAHVASTVGKKIGSGQGAFPADKVAGLAMFSDPTRGESQPTVANGAAAPAAAPGTSGDNVSGLGDFGGATTDDGKSTSAPAGAGVATLTDAAAGQAAGPGGFGALSDRTVSWCLDGDSTCAIPEGSPLRTLIAKGTSQIDLNDPQGSLMRVADTLGPAVVLGGVETLADDLSFGPNGFEISRAETTEETMIGRIAAETERPHGEIGEMGTRLVTAGLQLGGMALAAGITFAKDVITPTNLAQIAAAGAADPLAAVPVVASKLAQASLKIITPATATGVAARVFDEIKAAGLGDAELADVAVQAASWKSIGSGAYASTPVTVDGRSSTDATSDWALAAIGDITGQALPGLESVSTQSMPAAMPTFDSGAISSAMSLIGGL